MPRYLTEELTVKAMDLVEPAIEQLLRSTAKRFAGHLRISRLEEGRWSTIATRDYGDRKEWEHDYEGHATGKEKLSQRTGMSSREVQMMHPTQLEPGDTVYFGSVINSGKSIVVAFSGVESYFDMLIAKWVLAAIQALIEHELEEQRRDGQQTFVPA